MHEPSGPDYRSVIRQHFAHISMQSSSRTTVVGGLMPYLGAFCDDPDRVLILSGADTSDHRGGRLLAFSDALIAAWEFEFNAADGDAFSVRGDVVPASALGRVELLPESTAYPAQFGNVEPDGRPAVALHIDGVGVFTVGYRQQYRWTPSPDVEAELRIFRDVLGRV